MALSPKLALRQSATLIMTPQLQQAIKLLQLSNQELDAFVESEIMENPLLERESAEGGIDRESENTDHQAAEPAAGETQGTDADAAPESEPASDENDPLADDAPSDGGLGDSNDLPAPDSAELTGSEDFPGDDDGPMDTDFENVWTNDERSDLEDAPAPQFADWGSGGSFDGEPMDIEERLSGQPSLRDHLSDQISMIFPDPRERMIASVLVDGLDEAGYLRADLGAIAEDLGISADEAERVLLRAQDCDPCGVFARDLGECLALQLKDRDRFDPAMQALIKNLDRLARREIPQLKRICGVDDEDFADMVAEIQSLDPKPGLAFGEETAQTVIPDVIVRPKKGGGWDLELNADTLPRVLVNQAYYAEVTSHARSKGDRDYINDRLQSANWLVKALHQRATTILKVSTEIVRTQERFLSQGVQHLKPLTLREVADAIGMHESTVSRVTSNKYMATPRGVFELKYFFTTAIASVSGGEAHSAESVRHRIKALIDQEQPKAVLSDDKIVDLLSGEGIDIARRTVAKYRESMRIPSSVQRRREKAISL
ncbi:MAG: RNA polymerase factor sigma-54 [Alphaproteobacteria bacterium]|nr:RNA polymerase factor sigma-54 [Alphaproteobacteria bacterium]